MLGKSVEEIAEQRKVLADQHAAAANAIRVKQHELLVSSDDKEKFAQLETSYRRLHVLHLLLWGAIGVVFLTVGVLTQFAPAGMLVTLSDMDLMNLMLGAVMLQPAVSYITKFFFGKAYQENYYQYQPLKQRLQLGGFQYDGNNPYEGNTPVLPIPTQKKPSSGVYAFFSWIGTAVDWIAVPAAAMLVLVLVASNPITSGMMIGLLAGMGTLVLLLAAEVFVRHQQANVAKKLNVLLASKYEAAKASVNKDIAAGKAASATSSPDHDITTALQSVVYTPGVATATTLGAEPRAAQALSAHPSSLHRSRSNTV